MSSNSIHLRSENPALLVEFNLYPGTHARIGAAPDAEISLPLAGLAEYSCRIGRTLDGRVYVADTDGENQRFIELPAALPLPPFQFVVFHPPADSHEPVAHMEPETARRQSSRWIPASIITAAAAGITALIIVNISRKPAEPPAKPQTSAVPVTEPPPPQDTPQPAPKAIPAPTPEIAEMAKPAEPKTKPAKPEPKPDPPPAKPDLESLVQRIAPAVFRLEVKDGVGNPTCTGTAFTIAANGLAVTNFHVIEHGSTFTARTTQGAEFSVSGVTATDPAADLALITIKGNGIPFLELGESESLKIGAAIAVFGAPEGLTGSLSNGILSAKRTGAEFEDKTMPNGGNLLQITAPISHGSSGSPVIDQNGKVVAVAAANIPGDRAQSLNLGIPVEAVKKLQSDAASGLADLRQTVREIEKPHTQPITNPDMAFCSDPDFTALKKHLDSADWIQCLKIARLLADRHPESSSAHLFLGISLSGIGLNEQAETSFKRGIAISPANGDLWRCLGWAQEAQNKTQEARDSLKRSAGISPDESKTWQLLAISYLRTAEYLDAVSPLENLRKLDRPECDRLIALARSLRVHPPELRAMLDHFDNMPEDIGTAAEAPTTPEKLASSLVTGFLRHGEEPNIQTELADYAATVDPYFDQGRQGRAAILKDITTYRAQWPQRSLRLIAVESARRDDVNTLEATYRLRFTASDGRRNRSGTLVQGIRYTLTNGRWLVSGIQTVKRVAE